MSEDAEGSHRGKRELESDEVERLQKRARHRSGSQNWSADVTDELVNCTMDLVEDMLAKVEVDANLKKKPHTLVPYLSEALAHLATTKPDDPIITLAKLLTERGIKPQWVQVLALELSRTEVLVISRSVFHHTCEKLSTTLKENMIKYNEFEYLKEELMEEEAQPLSREASSAFGQSGGGEEETRGEVDGDEDSEKMSDVDKDGVQSNMSEAVKAMNLGRRRGGEEEEEEDGAESKQQDEESARLDQLMGSMRWLTRGRRKAKEIIAKTLEKKSYSSDEVLMQKGGAAEHIYFIEEGTIEVFDDGETLRKELKRGESFGVRGVEAVELLFGLPTSFTKAAGEAKDPSR
ncbi:hypothetical protein GUITHDRAFT_146410 [Guillardia theta CCMP2712]|uniref:Cyclic nucleotide-binding domain-containing protein n=1 Tax=Guillardia theta (strain CCMP2712) TaxID=905079 RepID=L1IH52_GUITC|nr:hypothetical protein GUITHDRAFT_146410 [Guillardia theta CCMP2712]EKX35586.1 hypothetical protein GUITHDRAFT_146410 [Guillardia theta CCMP2712]|eukprot:XP_005822566.1 hypothetical protein GUITHDRAFT_146410 [Guillardia theta CCMP2712]